MPVNSRPISVSFAVICFFGIAAIGWINGLSPFTCCKRAVLGALFAYAAAGLIVKAINAILINAIITNHINKQKASESDGKGWDNDEK